MFSLSVLLNSFPQNSFPVWFPTEAIGQDAMEGVSGEEREEEGNQEEEQEEEEEKKVAPSQTSATSMPDLLEFERWEQLGWTVYSHRASLWRRGQALQLARAAAAKHA